MFEFPDIYSGTVTTTARYLDGQSASIIPLLERDAWIPEETSSRSKHGFGRME
jgi:hypothetical protein